MGGKKIAESLIKNGANIDVRDADGASALNLAVFTGNSMKYNSKNPLYDLKKKNVSIILKE